MILQYGDVLLCSLSWKLIDRILIIPFHNYMGACITKWTCIVMRTRREFSGSRATDNAWRLPIVETSFMITETSE